MPRRKRKQDIRRTDECDEKFKPHLLIYAHYYIPDIASTGQLIKDLAEGMLDTFHITVICVVPSYLGTIEDIWKTQKYYHENINGVDVIRVSVPEFIKTDTKSRVKNIVTYFFRAMSVTGRVKKVDYVMSVSQPPILGGLLGVYGKLRKRSKFIYQIQDFNPEQTMAISYSKNDLIIGVMMLLDKFSCRRADLVITVGRDLIDTLNNRFRYFSPPKSVLINNWIDEKEIYPLEENHPRVKSFKGKYGLENKFVIMYSGNIGLYYDLENLMKVIEKFKGKYTAPNAKYLKGQEVVFAFVGTGAVLDKLIMYKESHNLYNVVFIPYQPQEDLIYSLNAGDVHWCVNAKGIKGVSCPSKYYGIMAVGKPVLGVLEKGSEVRCLIEDNELGLVCEPGEYAQVEKNIWWFLDNAGGSKIRDMGKRARECMMESLTKEKSLKKYKSMILQC